MSRNKSLMGTARSSLEGMPVLSARAIVTRRSLNAFDAFFTDDRNHGQSSYKIGPPQVEERVEQEADEQNG